jgi:hypothetical protein
MLKRHKQINETELVIREHLTYSPEEGILRWKKSPVVFILPGNRAGCKHVNGHIEVRIKGRCYMAHHLIWLLHYGEMPKTSVFHLNGNKADNRISNLSLTKG